MHTSAENKENLQYVYLYLKYYKQTTMKLFQLGKWFNIQLVLLQNSLGWDVNLAQPKLKFLHIIYHKFLITRMEE